MLTMALRKKQDVLTLAYIDIGYQQKQTVAQFLQVSHYIVREWPAMTTHGSLDPMNKKS
jgi:hypothetical protein